MMVASATQVADTWSFPSIEGNLWFARITVVIPPGPFTNSRAGHKLWPAYKKSMG
jgi:hypothetical protein